MRHLCDSNLILAIVLERHKHHISALRWLDGLNRGDRASLCRHTQISLLRLLTTEAVMKEEVQTNSAAISVLAALMTDTRFEFIAEEPVGLQNVWFKAGGLRSASPKIWTDAYLAAFAKGHSLRLVTFDKAFKKFQRIGLDLLILS